MTGRTRITIEDTGELLHEGPTVLDPRTLEAARARAAKAVFWEAMREAGAPPLPFGWDRRAEELDIEADRVRFRCWMDAMRRAW